MNRPRYTGIDTTRVRYGDVVLATPEVNIYWKRETGVVSLLARGGRTAEANSKSRYHGYDPEVHRPTHWQFAGQDAKDFLTVAQVAFLRGGVNGLRDALREIFEPRSTLGGMYWAELRSYRRVNGMIVRDMD